MASNKQMKALEKTDRFSWSNRTNWFLRTRSLVINFRVEVFLLGWFFAYQTRKETASFAWYWGFVMDFITIQGYQGGAYNKFQLWAWSLSIAYWALCVCFCWKDKRKNWSEYDEMDSLLPAINQQLLRCSFHFDLFIDRPVKRNICRIYLNPLRAMLNLVDVLKKLYNYNGRNNHFGLIIAE